MSGPIEISYFAPDASDAAALSAMARAAFADTFAAKLDPGGMAAYLDRAYGPQGEMARDFGDPAVLWRAARRGADIIGYIKLSRLVLDVPGAAPDAMELRQLYVMPEAKGSGVADTLTLWGLAAIRDAGAREAYLAVFDDNHRARAFYARHGFIEVARCDFDLGGAIYEDCIWRLAL